MEQLGLAIGIAIILFLGCAGMTYANWWMMRRTERNLAIARKVRDVSISHAIDHMR